MAISIEDVEKTAKLAKLRFSDDEKQAMVGHLEQILTYVEKLSELDTEGVPPTTHVLDLHNIFRNDVVEGSLPQEEALKNAPRTKKGYFSVPKVIN